MELKPLFFGVDILLPWLSNFLADFFITFQHLLVSEGDTPEITLSQCQQPAFLTPLSPASAPCTALDAHPDIE